jgi:hypothetical protein
VKPMRILGPQSDPREYGHEVVIERAYHFAQLLIEPISSSSTCLLVWYLCRNPLTQMSFVVFSKRCSPRGRVSLCSVQEQVRYVLFTRTSAARILVDERGVYKRTLLNAFLYPQVRLDMFIWNALVCLDKMLKDFCVWVRKNDLSRLRR